MKPSRIVVIALLATLAFPQGVAFLTATAHADSANANAAGAVSCAITADDLAAIQTAAAQGLLAELAARRELLSRTIACAQSDAETLRNELSGVSLGGIPQDEAGNARTIQSQLSGKLDDAITYYSLELAKVQGAGIAGTQAVAKEVLAWRAANYEPLADNVQNFELWVTTQPLVAAAANRLNGISNLVTFFEQAGPNGALQTDLAAAQALMQAAKGENQAAETALLQSLPPDQVRAEIQQSLQSLSDIYQKFFDIANAIQSLLPAAPAK